MVEREIAKLDRKAIYVYAHVVAANGHFTILTVNDALSQKSEIWAFFFR